MIGMIKYVGRYPVYIAFDAIGYNAEISKFRQGLILLWVVCLINNSINSE